MKWNWKMWTCIRLDLESLGSWPTLYAQKLTYWCALSCHGGANVWGEPAVSCRWTGWVWEITGWSWRLQEIYDHLRGIYRIYLKWMKRNRTMSTCNRLDSESLGSWPTLYAQKLNSRALMCTFLSRWRLRSPAYWQHWAIRIEIHNDEEGRSLTLP